MMVLTAAEHRFARRRWVQRHPDVLRLVCELRGSLDRVAHLAPFVADSPLAFAGRCMVAYTERGAALNQLKELKTRLGTEFDDAVPPQPPVTDVPSAPAPSRWCVCGHAAHDHLGAGHGSYTACDAKPYCGCYWFRPAPSPVAAPPRLTSVEREAGLVLAGRLRGLAVRRADALDAADVDDLRCAADLLRRLLIGEVTP
jgi:hypothetical protein